MSRCPHIVSGSPVALQLCAVCEHVRANAPYVKLVNAEGRTLWWRETLREALAMLAKWGYTYEPVYPGTNESADIIGHFRQTSGKFESDPLVQFVTLWMAD